MVEGLSETRGPLPEWASKWSDGTYLEVGAVLPTRDGRHLGNSTVTSFYVSSVLGEWVAEVVTDAGNTTTLTEPELQSLFYPPEIVCKRCKLRKEEEV